MRRSLILLAGLLGLAAPAFAQGTAPAKPESVTVELNKLEGSGADCQATVVATNGASRLESLRLDLVIFDGDGVVAKRLAAELGPLAAKKTVVKTFPVKDLACASISRVVLNDVLACNGPSGPVENCIDDLALRSRAKVDFWK